MNNQSLNVSLGLERFASMLSQLLDAMDVRPEGGGQVAIYLPLMGDDGYMSSGTVETFTPPDDESSDLRSHQLRFASVCAARLFTEGQRTAGLWDIKRARNVNDDEPLRDIRLAFHRSTDDREIYMGFNDLQESFVSQGYGNALGSFSYELVFQVYSNNVVAFSRVQWRLGAELLDEARLHYGLPAEALLQEVIACIFDDAYASGLVGGNQLHIYNQKERGTTLDYDHVKGFCDVSVPIESDDPSIALEANTRTFEFDGFESSVGGAALYLTIDTVNENGEPQIKPITGSFAQFCRRLLKRMGVPLFPLVGMPVELS